MGLADEKISLCQPKHNSLPAEAQVGFNLSSAKKKDYHFCQHGNHLSDWMPFSCPASQGKVGSKLRAKGRSAEEKKLQRARAFRNSLHLNHFRDRIFCDLSVTWLQALQPPPHSLYCFGLTEATAKRTLYFNKLVLLLTLNCQTIL